MTESLVVSAELSLGMGLQAYETLWLHYCFTAELFSADAADEALTENAVGLSGKLTVFVAQWKCK